MVNLALSWLARCEGLADQAMRKGTRGGATAELLERQVEAVRRPFHAVVDVVAPDDHAPVVTELEASAGELGLDAEVAARQGATGEAERDRSA